VKMMITLIGALSFVLASAASGTLPAKDLADLKKTLLGEGGRLLEPGDADFNKTYTHWSIACTEEPTAIIIPATRNGLRSALLLLVANDADFTVTVARVNQDCLAQTEGYMIHTALLRKMEIDQDKMTVTLGAGVLIDEANMFVQGFDKDYNVGMTMALMGSMVGTILGGGFQWFHNFAFPGNMADNCLELSIMDYEGTVRVANANNFPDLFWALRGGGGQLGVIIEIVQRVQKLEKRLTSRTYHVPCNSCNLDAWVVMIDRLGNWTLGLSDDVGVLVPTGAFSPVGGVMLFITCQACDMDALVQEGFPEAEVFEMPAAFNMGTAADAHKSARQLTSAWFGTPLITPWDNITLADTYGRYPASNLHTSGFFMKEYHADIKRAFRAVMSKFSDIFENGYFVPIIAYLGGAIVNQADHAGNHIEGSRFMFAFMDVIFSADHWPKVNREMANVRGVTSEYWNYHNPSTAEEWAFGRNYDRIKVVREKYDPKRVFMISAAKNNGSNNIKSCFAPYDCSGHGQLEAGSRNGIPKGGCRCTCDDGWTGTRCKAGKETGSTV